MKKIILIFILIILFLNINSSIVIATDYNIEIKKLQAQIEELNKKIKKDEFYKKNDFLNGITFNTRLHINANYYNKSEELKKYNITSNYNNDFSIKRARITIGKQISNFLFNFEVNYKKDKIYLSENYIAYNLNDEMMLYFGQVLIPSFMENVQSSNTKATIDFSDFIKENWIDDYLIGLNYIWKSNIFGISTGIFGNSTDEQDSLRNNANINLLFRGYYTPLKNNIYTLHLGLDLFYKNFNNDAVYNPNYIKNKFYYGLEFAFQYKYIIWTTEFIKMYYKYEDSKFNGNKFNFDGLYAELIVNFTGEKASYNKSGYFGNINVKNSLSNNGFGAFQGVLRYSFTNGKGINNGFLNNIGSSYGYTFGLTWIPENYFRLLFNYSKNKIVKNNYIFRGKYDSFKMEARMFF